MKKFALVASLVALTAFATLSGCSSGQLASDETSNMPAEAAAGGTEFNSLADANGAAAASAEPSPGAVIDTANPSTTVADNSAYSPPSFTDSSASAPVEKSPVNLGASSAGRAH